MNQEFSIIHGENESIIRDPEGNIVFHSFLSRPLSSSFITRKWFDLLSTNEHEETSHPYGNSLHARIDLQRFAEEYKTKRETLVKKPSNDTHGYWIREIDGKRRVLCRVYALPHDSGFSLYQLHLTEGIHSFNRHNPKEFDFAKTYQEADNILRKIIDNIYLHNSWNF